MNPTDEAELSRFQSDRPGYIAKEREKEADKNAKGQAK